MLTLMLMLLPLADEGDKASLRYLKPAGDRWTLESHVEREKTAAGGLVYRSRTERGATRMTLEIHYDGKGKVKSGSATLVTGDDKSTARLTIADGSARLEAGQRKETHKVDNPIVTTAPDWSDILELVRRYDARKKGKQEFPGLWIHPTKKTLNLTFTIEPLGVDMIEVAGKPVKLERYRIRLRSGAYLVWADADRTVYKLMSDRKGASPVVLDGMEKATRALGPQ